MEESLTNVISPTNTNQHIPKKICQSAKVPDIKTSIKVLSEQYQFSQSNSLSDILKSKSSKPFLIHKRRLTNNNTLIALEPNDNSQHAENASTDNEDEGLKIDKNFLKKDSNSYILKDFQVLNGLFPFQVDFRLIFRASDHQFSTQKFHQLCDYETNTLTICKTKSNQIIGGYTPLPWAEDFQGSRTFFKTDKDYQTFLFNLNKRQKYPLGKAKRNKAICCFKSFGPTFGGGYDLQIGNRADQTYSSASYFPRSFACESKGANQKHLTGSKNKQFKILEWEVYKVTKKTLKDGNGGDLNSFKLGDNQSSFLDTIKKGLQALLHTVKQKKNQDGATILST